MEKIPSIGYLEERGIDFEIMTFPAETEKGTMPIARVLGVDPAIVVKTLVVKGGSGKYYVCLTGGNSRMHLGKFARAAGEARVIMASPEEILEQTGYRVGAIPPFALARRLPTYIDRSLASCDVLYVGAGVFGTEILISPENLRKATEGAFADIVV